VPADPPMTLPVLSSVLTRHLPAKQIGAASTPRRGPPRSPAICRFNSPAQRQKLAARRGFHDQEPSKLVVGAPTLDLGTRMGPPYASPIIAMVACTRHGPMGKRNRELDVPMTIRKTCVLRLGHLRRLVN